MKYIRLFLIFLNLGAIGFANAQPVESITITPDGDALLIDWSTADQAWSARVEKDTYLGEGVALMSVSVKTGNESFIKTLPNVYYRGATLNRFPSLDMYVDSTFITAVGESQYIARVMQNLAIGLQKAQFTAVEKALGEIGLQARLPVSAEEVFTFRDEYIQNRNLKTWSFYNPNNPLEVVDILITEDVQNIKTVEKKVDRLRIQVASIADLIRMKTQSGRPQDIEDIKALEKLQ